MYRIRLYALFSLIGMAKPAFCQDSPLPAGKVMAKAYRAAVKEDKQVLLIFHASWCGWCKKMDQSLNDPSCKSYFDDHFVITHLTVLESKGKENLENPGAENLMNQYNGKQQGLPYWVILDKNGKLLFDSQIRKKDADGNVTGSNIGCPASAEEVNAFVTMLSQCTKLSVSDQTAITERFRKNQSQ